MAIDEGYIKFNLAWEKAALPPDASTRELARWRNLCFQKKYIGIADGIGYGNISQRYHNTARFIISGTQTGGLQHATRQHFTLVTRCNFARNTVACRGPVKASAESLTHAMVYRLDKKIKCVIHIHHARMWENMKFKVPSTGEHVPYGTIEMCREVESIYKTTALAKMKIFVMAGHQDGIIVFGENFKECVTRLDAAAALYKS